MTTNIAELARPALAALLTAGALACQGAVGDDDTREGSGGSGDLDPRLAECQSLAPGADPAGNREAIRSCLVDVGEAVLAPGDYPIDQPIDIPASGVLRGADPAARPVLRLMPGHGGNTMIGFRDNSPADHPARVADIDLDAHGGIDNPDNQAIVMFAADNAVLERADVFTAPGTQPPGRRLPASVYFICDTCRGGEARQVRMFGNFYGAIFRGQNADAANRVAESEIFANQCDPITFAGYGVAEGNWIHDNGWDCANGPIPGGGIYTLTNPAGGVIRGNTIERTCGHGLDLDRAAGMVIEDNLVSEPGHQFGGTAPWCGWAAGALLHGLRDSVVRRNVFSSGGAANRVGPGGYDIYARFGQPAFSDLPLGGDTVVGVIFSEPRDEPAWSSERNVVEDNEFRAACADGEGCLGLGLFASRGTGYAGSEWSAGTTNYLTGNRTFGSNVGSVRCGGNWYAGNSDCPAGATAPCNDDDYQHAAGDFRNDDCSFF